MRNWIAARARCYNIRNIMPYRVIISLFFFFILYDVLLYIRNGKIYISICAHNPPHQMTRYIKYINEPDQLVLQPSFTIKKNARVPFRSIGKTLSSNVYYKNKSLRFFGCVRLLLIELF